MYLKKERLYRSDISTARWIAYDLPGNAGWILYFAGPVLLLTGPHEYIPAAIAAVSVIPALLMLTGIAELIGERIHKLDRTLSRIRLLRGFGVLTLGGILGTPISAAVLISALISGTGDMLYALLMLAGGILCGLFAGLLFKRYRPIENNREDIMGLFKNYVSQTRKPEGRLGKMMLGGMNSGHAKMADWGLSHLTTIAPETLADLGCGGGRNVGELLKKYPGAKATAVDYSELSVEKTIEYNREFVSAGRLEVRQGNVSALELPDSAFDLATAFETIYFWPGLEKCFTEAARILKDGGYFMIVNESDGTDAASLKFEKIIDGMKCYTAEQISDALRAAGFGKVKTDHHKSKPWITVLAKK